MGRGWGRGWGYAPHEYAPPTFPWGAGAFTSLGQTPTREQETEFLKDQQEFLRQQMEEINKRLQELATDMKK